MTEVFKTKKKHKFTYMKEIFYKRLIFDNPKNNDEILSTMIRTVSSVTEAVKYREQRHWVTLPQHIRNA